MKITRRALIGTASATLFAGPASARNMLPLTPDPSLWKIELPPVREAYAPGPNGQVYWRAYGYPSSTKSPVVVLHGGPAAGSTYMRPYAGLAVDREVILYDQSGCGNSAQPSDLSLYSVDNYVLELEMLRQHLGFNEMVLLGHSWGALLAPAYAAYYPQHVKGLILAGGVAKVSDYQEAASRWISLMGRSTRALISRINASGSVADPDYVSFLDEYYHQHVLRLLVWPKWVTQAFETCSGNPVYQHMNGPNEFAITGTLMSLNLTPNLKRITAPVLVTCGEFDEAPPWIARRLAAALPNARFHAFAGLSHTSHIEDPARVVGVTSAFISGLS